MKKKLFLLAVISLVVLTGCGKEKRTAEYLFKEYTKVYTDADVEAANDIFPPFYTEYAKDLMTKENVEKMSKEAKAVYGDDLTITFEITKQTKFTDEELKELNESMASNFKTSDKASECYKLEGTSKFKGSKKEDSSTLNKMNYCKYGKTYYLVRY